MRIELEVACRLARYCCDVMNSSHGGILCTPVIGSLLKWRLPLQLRTPQGKYKFLLRLSCCPAFETGVSRNPAEVDRSQRLPMSALGQKQTWQRILLMSALPPRADIA